MTASFTQTARAPSAPTSPESDWAYCQKALMEVSRTFSQPIQFLPEEQGRALTVAYLLCRVADTIEDSTGVEPRERDELFSLFQGVLRAEVTPDRLTARFFEFELAEAPEVELDLLGSLPRVMAVFAAQRPTVRALTARWVSEMADGMRLYGRRAEGREFTCLYTMTDLERYCYFVAGTVGHLITELFDDAVARTRGIDSPTALEPQLREHAESFGLGLQMVNIVKDVTDDFERRVCYLPRELCKKQGFEPEELLAPENREAARKVVVEVADRAGEHLDRALEYVVRIPAEHHQLRLFCLLPLWMAVETLALARTSENVFVPNQPVKITREAVGRIIAECGALCRDDAALRRRYAELSAGNLPA